HRFWGAPCVCRQHRQGRLQSLLRADLGQDQQVLAPDARPARRAIPSLAMSGATTSATSVRAEHVPAVATGGSLLSGSVPRPPTILVAPTLSARSRESGLEAQHRNRWNPPASSAREAR